MYKDPLLHLDSVKIMYPVQEWKTSIQVLNMPVWNVF